MKICIDPGHGGKDSGACGSKSQEKAIVLAIGTMVARRLKANGHEVIMTRDNDNYPSLQDRCNIANNFKADIFVSIHANSADNKEAKGVETLCYDLGGEAEKLATLVNNRVAFSRVNRGVKVRPELAVLKGTKMPACLVEVGFISNLSEEAYMLSNTEHIADCIVKGINDYVNVNKPAKGDEVSEWAVRAWDRCTNLGILDGTRPKDNVTREEMAVIVDRLLNKLGVK